MTGPRQAGPRQAGGQARPATVLVDDGKIAGVAAADDLPEGYSLRDVGEAAVLPGLVDTHVHVNEPGRTVWEGFDTATRAAAAGGVTTIVDMPLNCVPPTTTRSAFTTKLEAISGRCHVDCAFWGGVVPGNADELGALLDEGVLGLKAFLVDSGVEEFPRVAEPELRGAMEVLARRGAPLLVHAELDDPPGVLSSLEGEPPRRYATYLASRPHAAEIAAIEAMIRLCRETGCWVHVVHLSSSEALGRIAAARVEGLPLTVETCPHYLFFAAEEIPDGRTELKCAPPIREAANRERLWTALADGTVDFVASDHSPSPPHLKLPERGDFLAAWGGISSLQLSLSAVWTQARKRGATLADLARWTAAAPARLAGLEGRKGSIEEGKDADLVVWDPEATFTVDESRIHHRHKLTPYLGETLYGVVRLTLLRGRVVYEADAGEPFPCSGTGVLLLGRDAWSRLNRGPEEEARAALRRCCGARRWVDGMLTRRPFRDREDLLAAAREVWWALGPEDWREAFGHHPRIGDLQSLRERFAGTRAWARSEQAGTASASEEVLRELAEGNRAYEERFGYLFIVCATGKSADEMLAILRQRLDNPGEEEIRVAAAEQARITEIRLEKLLAF